ncbi:MerR family transcriptional regulator [Pseudofrankia asymbiotica]|uniref:Heavy metal-responsive transcriptional regulator n=1 Tax=Pseudofrankia asymbiotica TaxID=1834516 RepID=A0A1V2IJN9_9ACTN|nr:MerR family transcriptional regulator [Pseudofrankia asymbiotica]ONH32631.1 heavy metal-responsive transcriptional regulator [Pseudofrankia asymbiotica]
MASYRVSQLADRVGVPASTLRFYESAGLLPAERTPSGYRVYGEEAVERLAFISSGKLLGLSLEEIGDLLGVWEHGVCAAVRERMAPLVAARIADADQRAAELAAFSARLAAFHAELRRPAPAGGCGPDCGCLAEAGPSNAGSVPLTLFPVRPDATIDDQAWRDAPVACALSGHEQTDRVAQWRELLGEATGREETADGVRVTFPPGADRAGRVAALAAAEQDCCGFFAFTLELAASALVLTVRAPEAAHALLTDLFGVSV